MKLNSNYINQLLEFEKIQNGLYIIATPIGNLGDITIRYRVSISFYAKILKQVKN